MSSDTRYRILDVAQELVQRRGVNAMSFQNIADAVGISKPSIHHHFPDKNALIVALLERYIQCFQVRVQQLLNESLSGEEQLKRYMNLFVETLREDPQDKSCLCGMLAAEVTTLSSEGAARVRDFFDTNVLILHGILQQGQRDGSLVIRGELIDTAAMVLSTLEGCFLVARCEGGAARMDLMLRSLQKLLGAA